MHVVLIISQRKVWASSTQPFTTYKHFCLLFHIKPHKMMYLPCLNGTNKCQSHMIPDEQAFHWTDLFNRWLDGTTNPHVSYCFELQGCSEEEENRGGWIIMSPNSSLEELELSIVWMQERTPLCGAKLTWQNAVWVSESPGTRRNGRQGCAMYSRSRALGATMAMLKHSPPRAMTGQSLHNNAV